MRHKIAPSILSADFYRLGEDVRCVEAAGADQLHVDVMDGHFVPNLSMGPLVCEALRGRTSLPLDVHLMLTDPADYLEAFVNAGAHHITVHVEANGDPREMCRWLAGRGIGRGLAVHPDTSADDVLPFLDCVDLLLVMTVYPGFGGQSFLGDNLDKVRQLRAAIDEAGRDIDLQVDGGVNEATIALCSEAGANVFVAGSSIFGAEDPADATAALRASAELSSAGSGANNG
ncbi:MAG: ribulose-phosphate 3-epimerase [Planctomycetota bacterium]